MKRIILLSLIVLAAGGLYAQSTAPGFAHGMTLNGATGLIVVPDARIGWENADFGVDFGYGIVWNGGQQLDHLPRFDVSLFRMWEIYGMFQFTNDVPDDEVLGNFLIGTKVQLFREGGSALAIGGDVEFANENIVGPRNVSSKIYVSATYSGNFFNAPAVTTATLGWQFVEYERFSTQFIYGMGFSMSLFPKAFKNYVFWITDFSNFSYSLVRPRVVATSRGAFNTGIRIRPFKEGKFNMIIDVVGTDLLDEGERGLSASISGGFAF